MKNTADISGGTGVGGIVGETKGCGIVNSLNEGNISGTSKVGGLGGNVVSETQGGIEFVTNKGVITATGDYAGGCFGYGDVKVESALNNGDVTGGGDYVGGICGYKRRNMKSSKNTAFIHGKKSTGGIAGYGRDVVIDTMNTGNVLSDTALAAGIVASSTTDFALELFCCYSVADVSGPEGKVGAIVGSHDCAVFDCFSTIDATLNGSPLVPDTAEHIKKQLVANGPEPETSYIFDENLYDPSARWTNVWDTNYWTDLQANKLPKLISVGCDL